MIVSPPLVAFVKRWESCSLTVYPDARGIPTCGWGHAWPTNTPWTQAHADAVLATDLREHSEGLAHYLSRTPSQQQYDALVSLAFNCGVGAIGHSGLMSLFNRGADAECANRFLQWNKSGGVVLNGLTKRRRAERDIYLNGIYTGSP